MSTVWVFGCSFSSGHLDVSTNQTYGNLISKELGYDIKNLARQGNCNEKINFDFIQNLNEFKENDIILYQYTSFDRLGVFKDSKNIDTYFSTAGLPEFGIEYKQKEQIYDNLNQRDLKILLDYTLTWQRRRTPFITNTPIKMLEFLKNNLKVKPVVILLNDDSTIVSDLIINFDDNRSLHKFLIKERLTLGDHLPHQYKGDTHPSIIGHVKIKEIISKHINTI